MDRETEEKKIIEKYIKIKMLNKGRITKERSIKYKEVEVHILWGEKVIEPRKKKNSNKSKKSKGRVLARYIKREVKNCEQCGEGHMLEVHHKNRDPLDNRLENLVKLCIRCHILCHNGEPVERIMFKKLHNRWQQH